MVENFKGLRDGCVITERPAGGFTGNAARFPENVASIHFAPITHSIVVFSYAVRCLSRGCFPLGPCVEMAAALLESRKQEVEVLLLFRCF